MKLKTIIDAQEPLRKIASKDMPVRTAYKLYQTIRSVDEQLGFWHMEREKLRREYFRDDNGKMVLPKENEQEFYKRLNDLLMMDVETKVDPVVLSVDMDIRLSYSDMVRLEPFVIFKEE